MWIYAPLRMLKNFVPKIHFDKSAPAQFPTDVEMLWKPCPSAATALDDFAFQAQRSKAAPGPAALLPLLLGYVRNAHLGEAGFCLNATR